jgi:hypothetical protein
VTPIDLTRRAAGRDACVECGLVLASDDDDAYCQWCGSRVPEPFEFLAWAEARAAEEACASPGRRVA